jgi:hypothetical protein
MVFSATIRSPLTRCDTGAMDHPKTVSPRATPSGAPAPAPAGQCNGPLARTDDRRLNGKFAVGNRCSWRHGKRSAGAVERRKVGAASRKAAGLILARLGLLSGYRHRPRPIREDQMRHLGAEALELLARLGVLGVGGTVP